MTPWFYIWLGTLVLLCVVLYVGDRGIVKSLEVAQDALDGWRACEGHWRNTIEQLRHAEKRIAELTQGDEWRDS